MFRDNASIYIEKLTNRFLCQPYIVILHTDFNAIFMGILVNTRKSTVLFRICNFVFLLSSIMYHHPIIPYQNYFYFFHGFYKHCAYSYIEDCKIQHSVCLRQRLADSACTDG